MKKLIIGIGFTALMSVTGLQAGVPSKQLTNAEKFAQFDAGLAKLNEWAARHPGQTIPEVSFQTMAKFSSWPQGQAILQKYQHVNAQFARYQAAQTKPVSSVIPATSAQGAAPTLKACARVIAKLPKEAQKSCMAKFQENVRSFITKHQTALSRTAMLALFAGSIYWVYTTHPEMLDTVKDDMRSAGSFISSYVSSVWNTTKNFFSGQPAAQEAAAQAARINATQAMFDASAREAAVKAAQEAVAQAQSYVSGNQTALANAEAVLRSTPNLTTSNWLTKLLNADAIQQAYLVAKEAVLNATNAFNAANDDYMCANATLSLLKNN